MSNVVLVIDMVRGFLEPGHNLYCGDAAREIIPNIHRLLSHESEAGSDILFISDHHDPDDLEFQIFPVHCVKGTEEPDVIPELSEFLTGSNVVPKNRYSGFFNTGLAEQLRELAPDKIVICGVCTEICVLHTTSDARNRDYQVEVHSDCVATFDADAHRWALSHLAKFWAPRSDRHLPSPLTSPPGSVGHLAGHRRRGQFIVRIAPGHCCYPQNREGIMA